MQINASKCKRFELVNINATPLIIYTVNDLISYVYSHYLENVNALNTFNYYNMFKITHKFVSKLKLLGLFICKTGFRLAPVPLRCRSSTCLRIGLTDLGQGDSDVQ